MMYFMAVYGRISTKFIVLILKGFVLLNLLFFVAHLTWRVNIFNTF